MTKTDLLFTNRKDQHKLYAMDVKTGDMQKIIDRSVMSFHFDDEYYYYMGLDHENYRMDKESGIEMKDEGDN